MIDAIIALDDLHRAKKISDEAYQKRRAELKEYFEGKDVVVIASVASNAYVRNATAWGGARGLAK